MKKDRNIFDLFKDNQHKLDERPNARAWRRLERRLDRRSSSRRIIGNHRVLYMAAAVALLVIAVMVVMDTILQKNRLDIEIVQSEAVTPETQKVIEFTHAYTDQLSMPIAMDEGNKKELAVRKSE